MRKKVGILNFHFSTHNYGAVLQAAALESAVESLGYTAEHINLIPLEPKLTPAQKLRHLLGKVKRFVLNQPEWEGIPQVGNSGVFEDFRNKWIDRSQICHSHKDLLSISDNYSAIVVGSDQVWRPHYTEYLAEDYFLSFVSENTKKISYAASFGVSDWEPSVSPRLTKRVKKLLKRFDHISVRELDGVDICSKTFGVSAKQVLDPTLLIGVDFFNTICSDSNSLEGEIVYYKLDIDNKFLSSMSDFGKKNELPISDIYYNKIDGDNFYYPVSTWLNNIKNAKLVVTDSFHCTCMAILFGRPFVCIANPGRGVSRMTSLLNPLGLESHLITDIDEISDREVGEFAFDKDRVNQVLEVKRIASLDFLKEALKG